MSPYFIKGTHSCYWANVVGDGDQSRSGKVLFTHSLSLLLAHHVSKAVMEKKKKWLLNQRFRATLFKSSNFCYKITEHLLKKKGNLKNSSILNEQMAFPEVSMKSSFDTRFSLQWGDPSSIPGWGRSPGGGGRGMATHSSILAWRIPMDRGAWRATVHGVAKSQTRLSN